MDHLIISSSLGIIVHHENSTTKDIKAINIKNFFFIEKIYTKNKTDDDINKNQKYAIVFFSFALKNKIKKINYHKITFIILNRNRLKWMKTKI